MYNNSQDLQSESYTIYIYIIIVVHMVDCFQQASNLSHSSPSEGEHKHYMDRFHVSQRFLSETSVWFLVVSG